MGVIDVDALLAEVSDENPCGEGLEDDPEFGDMERAAAGKPEQEIGAPGEDGHRIIPGEPPDWRALKKASLSVLGRSKDLRAVVQLTRSLTATEGYPGLHDGLSLLTRLCEMRWDNLHPLLDPEDDNDPLMRVNTIETLAKHETVRYVHEAPLVAHNVLGRFGLREIEYASGEVPLPDDFKGEPPKTELIDGAFRECDLDELTATADAVNGSIELVDKLDKVMAGVMPITETPDLQPLRQELLAAQAALAEPLERRGITGVQSEGEAAGSGEQQRGTGEIATREDVVRAIDKICEFYRRSEPSSPVPMVLMRAKRLVPMGFLEIVQDLAPSGLGEVKVLAGSDGDEK